MTTEISAQIGGAAAENRRHIDSTGNSQPGSRACARRDHQELVILCDQTRMTRRKIFIVDPDIERAPAPRDKALIFQPKPDSTQRCFKARDIVFIPDQRIRDPHRMRIKGASDGNTRLPETGPAEVLDRSEKAGGTNKDVHEVAVSNSSREIFRKRTWSPA